MIFTSQICTSGMRMCCGLTTGRFSEIGQMDETLIQNWNARVADDDTVYVLGDAFWEKRRKQREDPAATERTQAFDSRQS